MCVCLYVYVSASFEPQTSSFDAPKWLFLHPSPIPGEVVLIDMEYSGLNYPAFDIGCFFCEFAGNFN